MKNNLLVIAAMMTLSTAAQAMMAPWYQQIRRLDTAVEAVFDRTQPADADEVEEMKIQIIQDQGSGKVLVGTDSEVCVVTLKAKTLKGPNGMIIAGAASYEAKINSCSAIPEEQKGKTMTYEKISAKLDKAAALGKMVTSAQVTPKGKLKILYSK